MTLNLRRNATYEGLPASSVLALAMFEQSGLRELIDSKFVIDQRTKLTPGNTVKAFLGPLMRTSGRVPLYSLNNFYCSAPNDLIFGPKVDAVALGPTALGRNLDRLFTLDLDELSYECYCRLKERYRFMSDVYNIDMTNFGITALSKDSDCLGAAVPERNGHTKDGHDERLVYSLLSVTDENGIVCFERPYDGSTSDGEMDKGAIEFFSERIDPSKSTLIADCKIVTSPLIELMERKGFGFVSKCPENFGKKVRERIVYSVTNGIMDPSRVRDGWEIYDTDADIEISGEIRRLRFVAYRTTDDIREGIEYLRVQGGKESKRIFARFESKRFNCEEDARREMLSSIDLDHDSAYDKEWKIRPIEVFKGYSHRGRPRKDELPVTKTEYVVDVRLKFNEERAKMLSQDRGVHVLITNLPRRSTDADNVRFGASADTVLKLYLGQYKIEHAFRLMKDGMGISTVYLHKPSRENAMMFITTIAAMIWDVIKHVMKKNELKTTGSRIADRMQMLLLFYDRSTDESFFKGNEDLVDDFLNYLNVLEIDPDRLF